MKYERANDGLAFPPTLYSNEGADVFLLNDGGRATVSTGIIVQLDAGEVGIVLPHSDCGVDAISSFITKSGEIKVEIRNDGSTAKHVKSGDTIATMLVFSKVEEKRGRSGTKTKGAGKREKGGDSQPPHRRGTEEAR